MPAQISKRACGITLLALIIVFIVPILVISFRMHAVYQVEIVNRTPETLFECVLVDNGTEVTPLYWRVPFPVLPQSLRLTELHPADCVCSYVPTKHTVHHVRWRDGRRYGVLHRTKEGTWQTYWFGTEDIELRGRVASFDLGTAKRDVPSKEELIGWGLEGVTEEQWEDWASSP